MSDGKGAYGTVHVMEEEMRAQGAGVFEEKPKRRTKAAREPENKAEGPAPANKSAAKG